MKLATLKLETLCRAFIIASVIGAGAQGGWLFGSEAAAQTPAARSLPMFEVDPAWPKIPAKWKVGDASSFAVDAQDNVWLLHRPRTLKPEQAAMAALPRHGVRPGGQQHQGLGRGGQRSDTGPSAKHGIHIDYKGFVCDRRQQLSHQRPAGLGSRSPTQTSC